MGERRGAVERGVAIIVGALLMMSGLVSAPPGVAAEAAVSAVAPDTTEQELAAALKNYLATKRGNYSVTVRELDGEQRFVSLSGTRRVEPASTIKLFYAWAAFRAIDAGTLSLGTQLSSGLSVGRCISLMIQVSDNYCAIDLRMRLGMKKLNALFASEGFPNTYIVLDSKGRYVTKRTSTNDLALLLDRLERGALLSEAMTAQFTKALLAQIWRHRITSGVQAGTVVGSKSGQLWVSTGMVEADTAIVHGPNSTYVLTAVGTHNATGTTIRGISTIVYRMLQESITTRASFPAQQYVTTKSLKLRRVPDGSVIAVLRAGTPVQVLSSSRLWMRVKVGSRYGWVLFSWLSLRDAYRWPPPVVTGDVAATGAACTVVGTGGDDVLTGTAGADVICGLEGNDTIDGAGGADTIDGGAGDDLLQGGTGGDYLIGGSGIDTVSYGYLTEATPVTADLDGIRDDGPPAEQDRIRADVENLVGSSGDDTLIGNAVSNTLTGGPGRDTVNGGEGTDTCVFDDGDSVIDGAVSCEENALQLGVPVADLAEALRAFSDTNSNRCLVNNCGVAVADYCIVNVSGVVGECLAWDGWGDGWWDGVVTEAGPYNPEADWLILDRSRLPGWATFVGSPRSYVLSSTA